MSLEVDNVTAGYGPITVLREVSMQVGSGQVLGVLGRNGMGKSTLIRCLSGLIRPDSGRILFEGRDVTALAAHDRARLGMTTVVQGRGMFRSSRCARASRWGGSRLGAPDAAGSTRCSTTSPACEKG